MHRLTQGEQMLEMIAVDTKAARTSDTVIGDTAAADVRACKQAFESADRGRCGGVYPRQGRIRTAGASLYLEPLKGGGKRKIRTCDRQIMSLMLCPPELVSSWC